MIITQNKFTKISKSKQVQHFYQELKNQRYQQPSCRQHVTYTGLHRQGPASMFASSLRPPREGSGRRLEEPLREPTPPPGHWVRPPSDSSLRSALCLLCCAGTACISIVSIKCLKQNHIVRKTTLTFSVITLTRLGCHFIESFMHSQRLFLKVQTHK